MSKASGPKDVRARLVTGSQLPAFGPAPPRFMGRCRRLEEPCTAGYGGVHGRGKSPAMVFGTSYRIGRLGRIAARRMWRWRWRRQHARHQRAAGRYACTHTNTPACTHPAADGC